MLCLILFLQQHYSRGSGIILSIWQMGKLRPCEWDNLAKVTKLGYGDIRLRAAGWLQGSPLNLCLLLQNSLENEVSLCFLYLGLGGQCTAQVKCKSFGILTLLCLGLGCITGLQWPARQGNAHNRWWQWAGKEDVYLGEVKEAPDASTERVLQSHDTRQPNSMSLSWASSRHMGTGKA